MVGLAAVVDAIEYFAEVIFCDISGAVISANVADVVIAVVMRTLIENRLDLEGYEADVLLNDTTISVVALLHNDKDLLALLKLDAVYINNDILACAGYIDRLEDLAAVLDLDWKKSFLAAIAGVLIASVIMTAISYGLLGLLGC